MTNRIKLLMAALSTAFIVGCNSLDYHANGEKSRVYPGVAEDCAGITEAHSTGMYAPFIFVYSVVDLPFSSVVDTLYLPSDIIDVKHSKHQEHNPAVVTNNVASQIRTNELWQPAMSPKQTQQWNMLPGP